MVEPYLKMQNIGKSFPGVIALEDVNFEAYPGEAIALIGANGAGKSTLMNILGGVITPDKGSIYIGGKKVQINSPLSAEEHGIAFVHQEMILMQTLTVMENLFITRFPKKGPLIDKKKMRKESERVLKELGSNISPTNLIRDLGTGDRQLVEIGRILLGEHKIFILDEPTSSLTKREKEKLFFVINHLKSQGYTIIYITHFLNEVFDICDRVKVLRGGKVTGGGHIKEITPEKIVSLMLGDVEIATRTKYKTCLEREPIFRVSNLNRKRVLNNISFELHKGEVLGLWGLLGSGRTEIARSIVGLDPVDSIKLEIKDKESFRILKPSEIRKWVGIITEERRFDGLFLTMSVKKNMSMANLKNLKRRFSGVIKRKKEDLLYEEFVQKLNIKTSNAEQSISTLSGGNQQKVIVGRWLQVNPPVIIMDEPTRGLDVHAKAEISKIINQISETGTSVILINSEIDEMISLCDRFLVVKKGKIVGEFQAGVTKEKLMAVSSGAEEIR